MAFKTCKKAVTLEPYNHQAYAELSRVLIAQARVAEAILVYKKALSLADAPAFIYAGLAEALKQNEQLEKAIALYQYAVKLFPNHWELRTNLVQCIVLQREQAQSSAIADTKNIQPYSYFFGRGRELINQGEYEAALAVYRSGNQQHSSNPFSYLILGNGYGFTDSLQQQLESYLQAIELDLSNFKLNQADKADNRPTLNDNQIAAIYQKIITGSVNSNSSKYLLLLARIASQRLSDYSFFEQAGKQLAETEFKSAAIAFLKQAELKGCPGKRGGKRIGVNTNYANCFAT